MVRPCCWALAALAVLWTAPATRADIVTPPAQTVTGPGGTGSASIDPSDSTFLNVSKTYDAVASLDVTFSVNNSDTYGLVEVIGNNTGATWIGFQYDIIAAP